MGEWHEIGPNLYFEVLSTIKWDDTFQPGSLFPSRATVSNNEYFVLFRVVVVVADVESYQVIVEDCLFQVTLETTVILTVVGLSEVYFCTAFRNRFY